MGVGEERDLVASRRGHLGPLATRTCIGEITRVLVLLVRMARKKSNTKGNRVKIGGRGTSSLLKASLGKRSGWGTREARRDRVQDIGTSFVLLLI